MASAESPIPAPSSYLTPLVIALAIIVSAVLALAGLHFVLKKLHNRVHPAVPEPARAHRGVDQKVLDSIAVQAYEKGCKYLQSQNECSVCLSGLEEGEKVRVLPNCGHVFHVLCIDAWFALHSTCPFCRSDVTLAEPVVVLVDTVEESDGAVSRDGEVHRSNSLVCFCDSSLASFREKLRLKRCLSLDSCDV